MTVQTTPKVNVQVHRERYTQLRILNRAFGGGDDTPLASVIRNVFAYAAKQGLVVHEIPGVRINALSDGIAVGFDKAAPTGFSQDGGRALAETIRTYIAGTNTEKRIVNMNHGFSVFRIGGAIAICIGDISKPVRTWPADLAEDFAALIEGALDSIANNK